MYLYDCQSPPCTPNSYNVAQAVDDAVRFLGSNKNAFCLLLSDAAKYTVAADAILKSLNPELLQVTCVAYCAMRLQKSNLTLMMLIS